MSTLSALDGGPKPELAYGGSLWSLLEHGASKDPLKLAIVSITQPRHHLSSLIQPGRVETTNAQIPHSSNQGFDETAESIDCLRWNYAQLRRAAASVSNSDAFSKDLVPGSTIVTILPSCVEWALFQWVSALRCLTFVPLDTSLLLPERKSQLISYLERLRPALLVVENEDAANAVSHASAAGKFVALRGLCLSAMNNSIHHSKNESWLTMAEIIRGAGSPLPKPVPDRLDRIALILFTSGTSTGRPKGCPATVKNLLASTANNSSSKFDSNTIALVQSANFRVISWGMSHNVWKSGGTVVIPAPYFSPAATLLAIEATRATHIGLVPIQMYLIAKNPRYSRLAVDSLRGVWVGGDVATAGLIQKTQETFPNAIICGSHGMTEGLGAFGWPKGVPSPLPSFQGILSCGMVMTGFKLRILDEKGVFLPRGEPGELHISGDAMIERYLDGENSGTFYKKDGDSWLVTGDIGVLDKDNFVYVLSRSKDIIKKGGTPLTPACLEATIMEHLKLQVSQSIIYV